MQIKDIQAKQGNIEVEGIITEKEEVRNIEKPNFSGKVANAVLKDETGQIKITLWNDDADKIKTGDKIKISNGWCSEWQGELQLSAGKFGKIELLESSAETPTESAPETPQPSENPDIQEEDIV